MVARRGGRTSEGGGGGPLPLVGYGAETPPLLGRDDERRQGGASARQWWAETKEPKGRMGVTAKGEMIARKVHQMLHGRVGPTCGGLTTPPCH